MPYKDVTVRDEYNKYYHQVHYQVNKEKEQERLKKRKRELNEMYKRFKKQLICRFCKKGHKLIHFHHTDPQTKFKEIQELVHNGYGIETIIKELRKCIPLCISCHTKEGIRLGQVLKRCKLDSNKRVEILQSVSNRSPLTTQSLQLKPTKRVELLSITLEV